MTIAAIELSMEKLLSFVGSSEFMVGARSAPTINSAFAIVYL
ncbi:hypothetical protein OOK60_05875 [Trichothermofontia sichuanensis B231]|nr:hypothetical protein [Trichothermofontia sichuanensis]UZQ55598.1 hypothetical protein OOK60_05875 [Trichothermofontia sichuanensis B231]